MRKDITLSSMVWNSEVDRYPIQRGGNDNIVYAFFKEDETKIKLITYSKGKK